MHQVNNVGLGNVNVHENQKVRVDQYEKEDQNAQNEFGSVLFVEAPCGLVLVNIDRCWLRIGVFDQVDYYRVIFYLLT
jgi:hypothetical protein